MSGDVHAAPVTVRRSKASAGKSGEISLCPRQRAIKLATRALVEAVGGFEASALYCRLGKSQLQRCCSMTAGDFLPADVAVVLEAVAGVAPLTLALAREQGLATVRLPSTEVTARDLHGALASTIEESGDVVTGTLMAMADGKVEAAEATALKAECIQSAEAFMRMHALLEAIEEQG